jgi:chitinase
VDPDTLIARVDFFDGSTPIGSKSAPPFLVAWGGLKAGSHVITAVATDIQGLSATSDPVTVFVTARQDAGDRDHR